MLDYYKGTIAKLETENIDEIVHNIASELDNRGARVLKERRGWYWMMFSNKGEEFPTTKMFKENKQPDIPSSLLQQIPLCQLMQSQPPKQAMAMAGHDKVTGSLLIGRSPGGCSPEALVKGPCHKVNRITSGFSDQWISQLYSSSSDQWISQLSAVRISADLLHSKCHRTNTTSWP